jgi:hypothetical protein
MYFPTELSCESDVGAGRSLTRFIFKGEGTLVAEDARTGMFVGTVVNADTGEGVCVGFAITATDHERDWSVGEGEPARALATEGEIVNAMQTVKMIISALKRIANNKSEEFFFLFDE